MPSPLKRRKTFAECSTKYADALSAGAAPGPDCADESAGNSAVSRIVVSATQAQRVLIPQLQSSRAWNHEEHDGHEEHEKAPVFRERRGAFVVVVNVTAPSRYFVAGAVLSGVRMFFSYCFSYTAISSRLGGVAGAPMTIAWPV